MNALRNKLIQVKRASLASVSASSGEGGTRSSVSSESRGGGGTAPGLRSLAHTPQHDTPSPRNQDNTDSVKISNAVDQGVTESVTQQSPKKQIPHNLVVYNATVKSVNRMWDQNRARLFMEHLTSKEWRMNNLYLIQDENGRTIPFRLRHEQREFFRNIHNRNFVPKARKLGMSTFLVIYSLDECLFPSQRMLDADDTTDGDAKALRSVRCGIIDLKEKDAWEKLNIAKFAWENGTMHPDLHVATIWKRLHKVNPLTSESKGEMKWQNGSVLQAGVSYTGKTPQILHVSELGPIAAQFPKVAENIVRGSINAVPPGGICTVETTMEGRFGECFDLYKLALNAVGGDLTPLDWKLHFFSWLRHPSYRIKNGEPKSQATRDYFAKMTAAHRADFEARYGFKDGVVPQERQAWWEKKKMEQKDHMWSQFPTVESELDQSNVPGQIYPEMTALRVQGRIRIFAPEPRIPLVISCDLGSSQNSAYWLIQPTPIDTNILKCSFGEGKGAMGLARTFRKWQEEFPDNDIVQILLPHDARITDKGSGLTFEQNLVAAGVPQEKITIVSRTPDVWAGIEAVQNLLPNCWFHKDTDAEISIEVDGVMKKLPSGVARMEGYRRTPPTAAGVEKDQPFPDICSHAADGIRTYAEAKERHLVRTLSRRKDAVLAGDPYDPFRKLDAEDRRSRKKGFARLATET